MVNFRELQIYKCGRALSIDVTLDYLDIFPNAYISELIIDTGKTYMETGPSATPIYTETYPIGTTTIVEEITKETLNINLNNEILFVYIIVDGLPVDYDELKYGPKTALKSVVNFYRFYQKLINEVKTIGTDCSDNSGFINDMLLLKAFEYMNLTCNYKQLISLWDRFFGKSKVTSSKGCGCNG